MDLITRQALPGVTPLGVSYDGFLGAIWAGVAVSGLALAARLYSRHRGPGRFFWDDAFAVTSWILVLITGALWQWAAKDMYYVIDVQAGLALYKPDFFSRVRRWLLVSLIVELFFYTSLVLVKLAFLFFFRRLGSGINYYAYIWWPVTIFSLIGYFVSVGDVNYKCLVGPLDVVLGVCNTPQEIDWTDRTLKANAGLDVASDFFTMLLPLTLLWKVRIHWGKKLAIFGLFALSIVTITIAIVRVASLGLTKRPDGQFDVSYLWLWSAIEPPVAIVVSCLSAFPQLFAQSPRRTKPAFSPSDTYLRMISRIRSSKREQVDSSIDLTTTSQPGRFDTLSSMNGTDLSPKETQDSLLSALTPDRPVVQVLARSPPEEAPAHGNHITHQLEYSVQRHRV